VRCERLVEMLERRNLEWEIFYQFGRSGSFEVERGELTRAGRHFHSGIGLRVGGHYTGFSYITGMNPDKRELEKLLERAVKLAKVSGVPFTGFPEGRGVEVRGLYDRRIDEIPFEEAHALALDYARLLRDRGRLSGSMGLAVTTVGVMNSNGTALEARFTMMSASALALLGRGSGAAWQAYTSLSFEELDDLVNRALWEAELSARAKKLEPRSGELVLEPSALVPLVEMLLRNLRGDEVYHGRSRFSSPGDEIGSFTLVDDSTLPAFPGSYPFDGEGSPGQRTVLIENGVVRNFLLDHTYASFLGMTSTGNAQRTFRSVPRIGPSNVLMEPDGEGLGDYEGVIVRKVFGEHTANPVTGDFSLTVELGYVIEKGEIRPFRDNMLVGNLFELLKTLRPGEEVERLGNYLLPRALVEARLL